jgi:signal transduction histidine kinase
MRGVCFYRYISHEMRTPLSAAAMGLSLLEDDIEQVPWKWSLVALQDTLPMTPR